MGFYFVISLDTKHITWHMVPSFLYDRAKSALPDAPLPSNPSTELLQDDLEKLALWEEGWLMKFNVA